MCSTDVWSWRVEGTHSRKSRMWVGVSAREWTAIQTIPNSKVTAKWRPLDRKKFTVVWTATTIRTPGTTLHTWSYRSITAAKRKQPDHDAGGRSCATDIGKSSVLVATDGRCTGRESKFVVVCRRGDAKSSNSRVFNQSRTLIAKRQIRSNR